MVGSSAYQELRAGLEALRTSRLPRVFPLVVGIDAGTATVNAFVAARVVNVHQEPNGPLVVRLQPAMMAVPMALTDAGRRGGVAHLLPSPYLARPRLAR